MTTTSGFFGALALIIFSILAFQYGAEKEHDTHKNEPVGKIIYSHPDRK